ncbi:MAG TPA: tail fiber domain-containing protein [Pyrinomonadaceae bacterium]|nr:tail fiber domain-containing protein [Pyrinomonadaceae bacterium]
MKISRRFALNLAFAVIVVPLATAQAQTPSLSTVNVTPEAGRVRVAPVGPVSDLKLEVVNEAGDTVFEAMQGAREQIDWHMTDAAGVRVAPGTYTVTVSYTTQAGKQRKRIEQVLVTDERMVGKETVAAAVKPNPQPLVDGGGAANRLAKFTDTDTLTSSVIMDVGGRVGIGTAAAPTAPLRLEVNGITRLSPGGTGGFMQFGTPNSETGLTWSKGTTSRVDIRFNGARLMLAAGTGASVPTNNGLVIDTSGKVGIGLASPASYRLHVEGGSLTGVYGKSSTTGVYGDGGTYGVYGKATSGGTGVFGEGGNYGVYGTAFNGVYGTGNVRGVWGVGGSYGVVGTGSQYGLYGTGQYGVWASGSNYGVYGVSDSTGVYGEGTVIGVHGRAAQGGHAGYFEGQVQVTSTLFVQGNVCANNIPCSSDSRLKQNVTNLKYGLDQLLRLRPVSWRWKSEPEGKPQMGLVAQEVEKVMPELVLKDADATRPLGLNYMALLPVAVKAIQEQQAQIREQQKQIQQLRAELHRVRRAVSRKRAAR